MKLREKQLAEVAPWYELGFSLEEALALIAAGASAAAVREMLAAGCSRELALRILT